MKCKCKPRHHECKPKFDHKKEYDYKKEYDHKKEDECCCKKIGYGIFDSNVVGFAVAIANVTDADYCDAQANAAVLVAGDDINARLENNAQSQGED